MNLPHEMPELPRRRPNHLALVGIALALIFIVATALFWYLWSVSPNQGGLTFELAKTCLQVISVVVLGGVITALVKYAEQSRQEQRDADANRLQEQEAAAVEQRRKEEAAAAERDRKNAEDLERQREDFKVRSVLLDRTTRCAQEMFITCQHVWRVNESSTSGDAVDKARSNARELLDRTYIKFNTEAAVLQSELGRVAKHLWLGCG